MDNSRFNIFEAVKSAYLFVGREWLYLLKAGLLPVMAQIASSLFIQFQRDDASTIEAYLWGLPASMLFAWFMFLEVRLLLLGERLDRLPQEREYLRDRRLAMKLVVITSLLFNMAMSSAIALLLAMTEAGPWSANILLQLCGMLIIGAVFWGVRFGVVPILAAVSFPIRSTLLQTRSMMFSLRLIGMGLVCLFPVAFLFQIFMAAFIDKTVDMAAAFKLTPVEQIALIIGSAPFSLIITALLNAAAAYALKQILGKNGVGAGRDGVLV